MSDTTIKVGAAVRDRLAALAAERGSTIRDLVTELASATPTRDELAARHAAAVDYLREQACPDLTEVTLADAEAVWQQLAFGQLPPALSVAVAQHDPNVAYGTSGHHDSGGQHDPGAQPEGGGHAEAGDRHDAGQHERAGHDNLVG